MKTPAKNLSKPPKSKVCSKCGEDKAASSFWKDRSRPDGLFTQCRPCAEKGKIAPRYTRKAKAVLIPTEPVTLDFFAQLPKRVGAKTWTLERAIALKEYLVTRTPQGESPNYLKASEFITTKFKKVSPAGCKMFVEELKRAHAAGHLSMQDYFAKGRPCRAGAKVLAVGKKK